MIRIFFVMSLMIVSCFADQCVWVDLQSAQKAVKILGGQRQILHFCEPCGKHDVCRVEDVGKINVTSPEKDYYEVFVNGKYIDLAYIFIKEDGVWKNLAFYIGLTPHNVSKVLDKPSECNIKTDIFI